MIEVARGVSIREDELQESFLRASGPGGQNVKTFCTISYPLVTRAFRGAGASR
jgi:hypothetical protein